MAETPPRAGIVGAADADMVGEFEELLLRLNKDDELACCWIRARAAALVAQAKATADPESFDLAEGTKEARDRFAMLKDLSKTKEFRKDKRFAALSDWKLAGLLVIDDENQPAPGLVLPSRMRSLARPRGCRGGSGLQACARQSWIPSWPSSSRAGC